MINSQKNDLKGRIFKSPDSSSLLLPTMQTVSQVLLLLVLTPALTAYAASASSQSSLFMDWVAQRSGKAGAASYYGEVDMTDVCMREAVIDGCSCYGRRLTDKCQTGSGACYSYTAESELVCCDAPHDYKPDNERLGAMVKDAVSAGKCTTTQNYHEEPIDVTKGDSSIQKVGEFRSICTLNKHADTCGEPACEDMTLLVHGDIFSANSFAFEAPVKSPSVSPKCVSIFGSDCKAPQKVTQQQYGGEDAGRYHHEEEYHGDGRKPTYVLGKGLAFIGTFSVTSRAHSTEYQTGIYQFVAATQVTGNTVDEPPADAYVARAAEMNFKFLKNKHGHGYMA